MNCIRKFKYVMILTTCLTTSSFASHIEELKEHKVVAKSHYAKGLRPSSSHMRELIRTLGVVHDELRVQGKKALRPLNLKTAIPASTDLTPYAVIVDQGELGSCTSNSSAQCVRVIKSLELLQLNPSLSTNAIKAKVQTLSRLYHYYYERKHMSDSQNNYINQDSGASIADAIWVLHNNGAPNEGDWVYNISKFTQRPPAIADAHAKYNQDAANIASEEIQPGDIRTVKLSLSQGFPVLLGISVYDSFESEKVAATGYVPVPDVNNEQLQGGHAVAVLGHDDNDKTNGYSGHFLLANSWGTTWGLTVHGQRGFFKLPYEFVSDTNLTSEIWRVTNASLSDISSTPTPAPTPPVPTPLDAALIQKLDKSVQADISNVANSVSHPPVAFSKAVTQLTTDYKSLSATLTPLYQSNH